MSAPGGQLVSVRLLGFPVRLHARATQQAEAMRREFQFIVEQSRRHEGHVPARLRELSALLGSRYEGFGEQQEEQVEDALAAGLDQLDELTFVLPVDAARAASALAAVLDEADAFCTEGQLLTLATSAELVAYRRWYLDNVLDQCSGGDPVPLVRPDPLILR